MTTDDIIVYDESNLDAAVNVGRDYTVVVIEDSGQNSTHVLTGDSKDLIVVGEL